MLADLPMVSVEHRMMIDRCDDDHDDDYNEDVHEIDDVCDRIGALELALSHIHSHQMYQIPNEAVYAAHRADFLRQCFHLERPPPNYPVPMICYGLHCYQSYRAVYFQCYSCDRMACCHLYRFVLHMDAVEVSRLH